MLISLSLLQVLHPPKSVFDGTLDGEPDLFLSWISTPMHFFSFLAFLAKNRKVCHATFRKSLWVALPFKFLAAHSKSEDQLIVLLKTPQSCKILHSEKMWSVDSNPSWHRIHSPSTPIDQAATLLRVRSLFWMASQHVKLCFGMCKWNHTKLCKNWISSYNEEHPRRWKLKIHLYCQKSKALYISTVPGVSCSPFKASWMSFPRVSLCCLLIHVSASERATDAEVLEGIPNLQIRASLSKGLSERQLLNQKYLKK